MKFTGGQSVSAEAPIDPTQSKLESENLEMNDTRTSQQPRRGQREQLERATAAREENVVVELTPESSASSTVRLEDLQATQALSGVRPGSSDESSLDSTPEGHVETLPPRPRGGPKQLLGLSRRAQQIGGFGGSGGGLPGPGSRGTRQGGFQTPGETFAEDPTPRRTATTTGRSPQGRVIVVSSDTEESLEGSAEPAVAARLFGSSTDTHRSESPQSQVGYEWIRGLLGAQVRSYRQDRPPLEGDTPAQRAARSITGNFAVVDSRRPGTMGVLEHRSTVEAPWTSILRISGLSGTHIEVFDDLLDVQGASEFYQFRAQDALSPDDTSLPILDFSGGYLPEQAADLLGSEIAVKLMREAINMYRHGWEEARAESRTVLDMQTLAADMDETSPADVEAATALVMWAVLTRAFTITPRLSALQCWLFTVVYDMFESVLLIAVESGVPAALESLQTPHAYTPAPTAPTDQGESELSPSSPQEMWTQLAMQGARAVRQWWELLPVDDREWRASVRSGSTLMTTRTTSCYP